MLNANQKGKRFERAIADFFSKAFGSKLRRTPCSGGLQFKGDIIALSGPMQRWSIECKNQEKLNIWKAIDQARRDAPVGKDWVVVFTKNNEGTYATIDLEVFKNLILEIEEKNNG